MGYTTLESAPEIFLNLFNQLAAIPLIGEYFLQSGIITPVLVQLLEEILSRLTIMLIGSMDKDSKSIPQTVDNYLSFSSLDFFIAIKPAPLHPARSFLPIGYPKCLSLDFAIYLFVCVSFGVVAFELTLSCFHFPIF